MEYLTSLDIFEPLLTLFEYIYNVFMVFGEISSTTIEEFTNSFTTGNFLTFAISNPFNDNIFNFTLNLGGIGNNLVGGILELLSLVFNIDRTLPLYVVLLILTIPTIIIFWLVNILKNVFN